MDKVQKKERVLQIEPLHPANKNSESILNRNIKVQDIIYEQRIYTFDI
jgi:hypothetical protein